MASQFTDFSSQTANPEDPSVMDIDPNELWQNREKVAIVDVRRPD